MDDVLKTLADIGPIVVDISTFGLLILAVVSAWFIKKQISIMREEGNVTRTFEFMKRYWEPYYQSQLQNVMALLNSSASELAKWQMYSEDPVIQHSCIYVFGLFEDIGSLYNRNLLMKPLVKHHYSIMFPFYFNRSEWLIKRIRERDIDKLKMVYSDWETMVRDMERH